MKVEDLMRTEVFTCKATDTLEKAVQQMRANDIGVLPVLDKGLQVIGMLTDRDVVLALAATDERPSRLHVHNAMTPNVIAARVGEPLAEAERRMQGAQIRRLPVINDGGQLVGILSLNDIAIAYIDRFDQPGVTAVEVARTLRAICTHRQVPTLA